jgi:hypothetical protein
MSTQMQEALNLIHQKWELIRAQYITAREAEVLYGVKADTLKRWFHRGHIAGQRQGLRLLLFRRSHIISILEQRMPHLLKPSSQKEEN